VSESITSNSNCHSSISNRPTASLGLCWCSGHIATRPAYGQYGCLGAMVTGYRNAVL